MLFRLCTSQCKPPHSPGRDIVGHLRGIFRYLTSERAAGIGDFDLFCTSPKNSGGVDRGISTEVDGAKNRKSGKMAAFGLDYG